MRQKITTQLLKAAVPGPRPYEINDSELKGFLLRVQPSGVMSYVVRFRRRDGRQTRIVLGQHHVLMVGEARERARQALALVVRGEDPQGRPKREHTLLSFIGEAEDIESYSHWLTAHQRNAQETLTRLLVCFGEFMSKSLGDLSVSLVDKWRARRLKDGIAPATVNRDIGNLKSLISKAVEWGVIEINPLQRLKPLPIDSNGVVRFLSPTEERSLFDALDEREIARVLTRARANGWRKERGYSELPEDAADHLKPMVVVSLKTGVRFGELTSLDWKNVDLDRGLITIIGSNAKSGRTRHIPLSTDAISALRTWRDKTSSTGLVFFGQGGKRIIDVKSAWGRVLIKAKIKKFRWHDLRHSFASKLVQAGVDLNTVRELLGHADLKITLRYAHLAPEHRAAAVAMLDLQPQRTSVNDSRACTNAVLQLN
jgi:integrase